MSPRGSAKIDRIARDLAPAKRDLANTRPRLSNSSYQFNSICRWASLGVGECAPRGCRFGSIQAVKTINSSRLASLDGNQSVAPSRWRFQKVALLAPLLIKVIGLRRCIGLSRRTGRVDWTHGAVCTDCRCRKTHTTFTPPPLFILPLTCPARLMRALIGRTLKQMCANETSKPLMFAIKRESTRVSIYQAFWYHAAPIKLGSNTKRSN